MIFDNYNDIIILMNIACIVFMSLFGVSSLGHLIICHYENEKWRHITKPLCLLFLSVALICQFPDKPFLYLITIFSLLGDILLLYKSKFIFFLLGAISFLLGHISCLVQIIQMLPYNVPVYWYFIGLGFYLFVLLCCYLFYKKYYGLYGKLGSFYYAILILMMAVSIFLICAPGINVGYASMILIGYILFFISDNYILYFYKHKDKKKKDLIVMSTYLGAELFICLSLVLLLL